MRFTTFRFALFAAALLMVYYRVPRKWQWAVLLAGSWIFYFSAGTKYLFFLLFTTLTTWFTTVTMGKTNVAFDRKTAKRKKKPLLFACLFGNFSLLALCKISLLAPLPVESLSFLSLSLPLGISFYMFQSMGYVIDVYRGTAEPERNPLKLALFVSYFPQLIQGPISKYTQLAPRLFAPHPYNSKEVSFGFQRILWGCFKKLVIADRIAAAVAALKAPEYTGTAFFLLTVFYAVQIYADFTGGIDMALGLSQALGIPLPENFIRPFFSKNTAEYWRRWHISLGVWMKDYIFYPISVSAPMRRLSKAARAKFSAFGKRLPVYAASFATWFITGIWHGLTPNFVVWGMLNCLVIVISEELSPLYSRFHDRFHLKQTRWYGIFEMVRMFFLMNLIRACDLFPNVWDYFRRLGSLFTRVNLPVLWDGTLLNLGLSTLDYVILLFGVISMLAVSILQEKKGSVREMLWSRPVLRYILLFALFLVIVLTGRYGVGYDASNFIYNQF